MSTTPKDRTSIHSDFLASLSDEDNENEGGGDDAVGATSPESDISYEGTLSKWTNYLHGWQTRYLVLRDGTLTYFKSEFDTGFGCRGSVSVTKASIEVHEFDDCRFDVNVGDSVYYLRAANLDDRQKWVDVLECAKQTESGNVSRTHLPKTVSSLSLSSHTSLHSSSSVQKNAGLREKLLEMETFRDILCRQMDTLQTYFDSCASKNKGIYPHQHLDMRDELDEDEIDEDLDELSATPTPSDFLLENNEQFTVRSPNGIDFRGEAITFKATTLGVIQVLGHCIELMNKRDELWKKKLEREREKCRKISEKLKEMQDDKEISEQKQFIGGPDFVEGPYSKLKEELFFDAMETALDEVDANDAEEATSFKENIPPPKPTAEIMSMPKHRLSKEVETAFKDNLNLIKERVDEENSEWYNVHEDGDLFVYRKDYEIDGIVCDPMKASHIIPGVTGHELCHYFFDKDVRLEWEVSVDKVNAIEKLSENTIIFHQIHKRIWPSAQRDTCFLSHIRQLNKDDVDSVEREIGSPWIVMNIPIDHDDAKSDKYVRAVANVIMVCQTYATCDVKKKKYTRDNIACKLTYMAQVNPGGWAPASVVRQITKREYPKFLRKFSSFVQSVSGDKSLMF